MAFSTPEREQIALGISVAAGCKPCTSHHLRAARGLGVRDEEMRAAVSVALSVRRRATELMERYFLSRLGKRTPLRQTEDATPGALTRLDELTAVGVAHAVSCTASLRRHTAAALAAGATEDDVEAVLELARHIKGRGAYHLERHAQPATEDRIFLFLDLDDSTAAAERLGHQRYSALIRSCFQDLTEMVIRYEAEIYQYVGDEVILTWEADGQAGGPHPAGLIFEFVEKLARSGADYETRFGSRPSFRGGMDRGPVTRADLGGVSPEVAYHGDVLNTASRLLELAKTSGETLLVSERIHYGAGLGTGLASHLLDEVALRGKSERLRVYAVRPAG